MLVFLSNGKLYRYIQLKNQTFPLGRGFAMPPTSNAWTPAGGPRIQLDSTRFWYYLPKESIMFPCFPHFTSLCLWPTGYKSKIPKTPSSDLINLLYQLTEFIETFYLLDNQCNINGYNSGTAKLKRCIGKGMWEGLKASVFSLGSPHSPNLHLFTSPEALQTTSFGF